MKRITKRDKINNAAQCEPKITTDAYTKYILYEKNHFSARAFRRYEIMRRGDAAFGEKKKAEANIIVHI